MTKREIDIALWKLLGSGHREELRAVYGLLRISSYVERQKRYRAIKSRRSATMPKSSPQMRLSVTDYRALNLPSYG